VTVAVDLVDVLAAALERLAWSLADVPTRAAA
jgi:hypothetical protein